MRRLGRLASWVVLAYDAGMAIGYALHIINERSNRV